MRWVALLVVLCAAVGLSACGSSSAVPGPITVSGAMTIPNAKVGTLIRCKGGPSVRVPHWFGGSAFTAPGVPGQIAFTRRHNGSVTVSCTPR